MDASEALAGERPALERATLRKVYLRVVPFCFLLYILCYVDRINVSFAALTMNRDLGLSRLRLRSCGRRVLLGLLPAGGAVQHHPGKGRRPALDRSDHDLLGAAVGSDRASSPGPAASLSFAC